MWHTRAAASHVAHTCRTAGGDVPLGTSPQGRVCLPVYLPVSVCSSLCPAIFLPFCDPCGFTTPYERNNYNKSNNNCLSIGLKMVR